MTYESDLKDWRKKLGILPKEEEEPEIQEPVTTSAPISDHARAHPKPGHWLINRWNVRLTVWGQDKQISQASMEELNSVVMGWLKQKITCAGGGKRI